MSVDLQQRKMGKENNKNIENSLRRKWYKESRDLASRKERYLIQNVRISDTGNYSCIVVNTHDGQQPKEVITYQLIVQGTNNSPLTILFYKLLQKKVYD